MPLLLPRWANRGAGSGAGRLAGTSRAPTPGACNAPPQRLTWVVHTCLDDVVQSEARWGLLVPQLLVEVNGQHLGHVVVVFAEVWVLLIRLVVQLEFVVGVTERHGGSVGGLGGRRWGRVSCHPAETSKGTERGFSVRQA